MVSMNLDPQAQGFHLDTSSGMPLPGINPLQAVSPLEPAAAAAVGTSGSGLMAEDPSKKVRKPYTIKKSRESWSEQEHDKFLEALQLFDRDWKKIEAFIGSKTVIQIRSHAQKYFLKVQKSGSNEHVPPPRPKRKAAHPYPQKASKIAVAVVSASKLPFQTSSTAFDPGYMYGPDSSSLMTNSTMSMPASTWTCGPVPEASSLDLRKDDAATLVPTMVPNYCCSSSNELSVDGINELGNLLMPVNVMPDFAQVYSFIGSVFDPNATNHLQTLKKMEPINIETVVLLMRNLSANLTSPDFEDHRRLLSSYDVETGKIKSCSPLLLCTTNDNSKTAIPAV
ncbi:hypothetical protein Dimus_006579 [Dionaea muscipula]